MFGRVLGYGRREKRGRRITLEERKGEHNSFGDDRSKKKKKMRIPRHAK